MRHNEIYSIQGTDYKQMTVELLEKAGLAEDIEDRRKKIGLKPNLNVAKPASSGATTHPELVDALLTYLQGNGFENIVTLESSWVGESTPRALKASGIGDVCKKHGVRFIDLQKDDFTVCQGKGMELKVCEEALKIDYLINIPVLKGHCQTTVTCALKNCKGLIPNSEKRRFHTMGLHKPIAHLNSIIHQDFILADNICGDLDFEEGGNPVEMNRVLAFKDPVLCDSFAAEAMGYQPGDVEYIRLAQKLGLGSTDVQSAVFRNLRPDGSSSKKLTPRGRVKVLSQYAAPDHACSACYGSLIYALDRLDEEGLLHGKEKKSIAVGQGYRGKSGKTGVGRCTRCFEEHLDGCPPKAVDIVEFLRGKWCG